MSLSPVISSPTLSKNKVVRPKNAPIRSGPDTVHGARLKVHQDGPGDKLATRHKLLPPGLGLWRQPHGLIVVDLNPLHLQLRGASVSTGWVNSVLIGDYFPELCSDLIAALASLQMDNFSHGGVEERRSGGLLRWRVCSRLRGLGEDAVLFCMYGQVGAGLLAWPVQVLVARDSNVTDVHQTAHDSHLACPVNRESDQGDLNHELHEVWIGNSGRLCCGVTTGWRAYTPTLLSFHCL